MHAYQYLCDVSQVPWTQRQRQVGGRYGKAQVHCASTASQAPWPPQSRRPSGVCTRPGHSCTQAAPAQPQSHAHRPSPLHRPCPPQAQASPPPGSTAAGFTAGGALWTGVWAPGDKVGVGEGVCGGLYEGTRALWGG